MLDFSGLIDVKIVILLIILGAGIKHLKIAKSINNKLIPTLLCTIGVILSFYLSQTISLTSFLVGVVSASLAVGIHSSGKNLWQILTMGLYNNTYSVTPDTLDNGTTAQVKNSASTDGIKISKASNPMWEDVPSETEVSDEDVVSYNIDENAEG